MGVRLFVGNLDPRLGERQLARFFLSAGMEVQASIPRDRATGLSRGFGFVEFETEEQAERALVVFDGRKIGRRALRLDRAFERPPRSAGGSPPTARENRETATDPRRGDDYTEDRGARKRRHGKHGSDRVRARGTRRTIE